MLTFACLKKVGLVCSTIGTGAASSVVDPDEF
jgi:hypothetical protein